MRSHTSNTFEAIVWEAGHVNPIGSKILCTMDNIFRLGCPLSTILFNLVLEQIIRPVIDSMSYTFNFLSHLYLEYTDDVILATASSESLQAFINNLVEAVESLACASTPRMRVSFFHSRGHRTLDNTLVLVAGSAKQILNLLKRANTNLVHRMSRKGGTALSLRDILDVHYFPLAFMMLSSPLEDVTRTDLTVLRSVTSKKIVTEPGLFHLTELLYGVSTGWFSRDEGDHLTVWSRARHAVAVWKSSSSTPRNNLTELIPAAIKCGFVWTRHLYRTPDCFLTETGLSSIIFLLFFIVDLTHPGDKGRRVDGSGTLSPGCFIFLLLQCLPVTVLQCLHCLSPRLRCLLSSSSLRTASSPAGDHSLFISARNVFALALAASDFTSPPFPEVFSANFSPVIQMCCLLRPCANISLSLSLPDYHLVRSGLLKVFLIDSEVLPLRSGTKT
ncbi:hypothetical protein TNCV_4140351 [Trichonephila clavipes]|nr:hypothetical protein TNCV_4140351 [Trichonephila clavipes]